MVIRFFLSAVSPSDVEQMTVFFNEDIVPAFQTHPECVGVELVMAVDPGVDGLVEGGALTRWTTYEAMELALADPKLMDAQARVRGLLRREPIRKVYEIL